MTTLNREIENVSANFSALFSWVACFHMKMCACAAFMEPSLLQSATIRHVRPTRDVFFNERKNHHYLLFPNKKNFYVRPKITLNSHLTQNYIGYTTCGLICARAQCSFDRDKARLHHASFRLFTQPSSLLRSPLGLDFAAF